MNEQIEKLIEKYQKNYKEMRLEIPTGEIIKDLKSLHYTEDTTQERDNVIQKIKSWQLSRFTENEDQIIAYRQSVIADDIIKYLLSNTI